MNTVRITFNSVWNAGISYMPPEKNNNYLLWPIRRLRTLAMARRKVRSTVS
jgi:hypothetical protein